MLCRKLIVGGPFNVGGMLCQVVFSALNHNILVPRQVVPGKVEVGQGESISTGV